MTDMLFAVDCQSAEKLHRALHAEEAQQTIRSSSSIWSEALDHSASRIYKGVHERACTGGAH